MLEKRLTPGQIRRKGLALMRMCWRSLLLAALLTALLGVPGNLANHYSKTAADRIEQAVFAEFEAENPRPDDPDDLKQWETERIAHAYFSAADIHGERAERLWKRIGHGCNLLGGLLSAVILVGVYTGLLARLRGSTEPFHLFAGFRHWKTAVWLKLRIMVCILGWALLVLLPTFTLPGLVGLLLLFPVLLWARMHYALVLPHMADDPDGQLSASQCFHLGTEDMNFFTVRGLIRTAWPLLLAALADTALGIASVWLPALAVPAAFFSLAAEIVLSMAGWPLLACIYEELRRIQDAKNSVDKNIQKDFSPACRIS